MHFFSISSALLSMAQKTAKEVQADLTAEERAFFAGKQLRLGVNSARPPLNILTRRAIIPALVPVLSRTARSASVSTSARCRA